MVAVAVRPAACQNPPRMNERVLPVIEEANANRATYERLCRSLSPEELATPIPGLTWQVQDYIAHLASIDIYVAEWFEHTADVTRWRPTNPEGGPFDIDSWNEARIVERKGASLDELFDEAQTHRDRLWTAVGRFSDEVLDAEFNFRGRDTSFLRYLKLWTAHDPAHYADMLRGLPAEKRDPETKAWLAKYGIA